MRPGWATSFTNASAYRRELAGALERGELFLEYQPSFALASGALEGFEALIRWQHPTLGLVSPDGFIPIAEESGLIVDIGRWVLYEATRQLKVWSDLVISPLEITVAINVSSRQLREPNLISDVRAAIAAARHLAESRRLGDHRERARPRPRRGHRDPAQAEA